MLHGQICEGRCRCYTPHKVYSLSPVIKIRFFSPHRQNDRWDIFIDPSSPSVQEITVQENCLQNQDMTLIYFQHQVSALPPSFREPYIREA